MGASSRSSFRTTEKLAAMGRSYRRSLCMT